jgi:large subunit ribosomal protein L1
MVKTTKQSLDESASLSQTGTKSNKAESKNVQRQNKRGAKYDKACTTIHTATKGQRVISIIEALEIIKKSAYANFDESIELHINVLEQNLKGEISLQHPTGKVIRIAVADNELIEKLEKNQIDFDVLLSTPQMMPKLTKFAKLLGPRGLMPNPKSGTVGLKIDEMVKRFSGNTLRYKTEAKAPIIHLMVGKLSHGLDKINDNILSTLTSIDKKHIQTVFLKSTMSPSIRVSF